MFLHEFCATVLQKYDKEIQSFNGNEFYIRKFCETNATLLSNIVRELIYDSIEQYKTFLGSFAAVPLQPIKQIFKQEREDPIGHAFQDAFLIVRVLEKDNRLIYEDQIPFIKESLLRIFDELVKVSHQLNRP